MFIKAPKVNRIRGLKLFKVNKSEKIIHFVTNPSNGGIPPSEINNKINIKIDRVGKFWEEKWVEVKSFFKHKMKIGIERIVYNKK